MYFPQYIMFVWGIVGFLSKDIVIFVIKNVKNIIDGQKTLLHHTRKFLLPNFFLSKDIVVIRYKNVKNIRDGQKTLLHHNRKFLLLFTTKRGQFQDDKIETYLLLSISINNIYVFLRKF